MTMVVIMSIVVIMVTAAAMIMNLLAYAVFIIIVRTDIIHNERIIAYFLPQRQKIDSGAEVINEC